MSMVFADENIFNFNYDLEEKIITGTCIHAGTYRRVTIEADELQNIADTIVNKPLLVNHDNNTSSVVGKVLSAWIGVDNNKPCVFYTAEVDGLETELLNKVSKGYISSCSIGFNYDAICSICGKPVDDCEHWFSTPDFKVLAKNINILELSICAVPADKDATVIAANFAEDLNGMQKNTKSDNMDDKIIEEYKEKLASKDAEITQMKESFDSQVADKVEEVMQLKQEISEIQGRYNELEKISNEMKERLSEIEEEKLSVLRKEVSELNEQVGAGLTQENIAELSEDLLNRYKEMFSNIIDNQPDFEVVQTVSGKDELKADIDEDASAFDKILNLTNRLEMTHK